MTASATTLSRIVASTATWGRRVPTWNERDRKAEGGRRRREQERARCQERALDAREETEEPEGTSDKFKEGRPDGGTTAAAAAAAADVSETPVSRRRSTSSSPFRCTFCPSCRSDETVEPRGSTTSPSRVSSRHRTGGDCRAEGTEELSSTKLSEYTARIEDLRSRIDELPSTATRNVTPRYVATIFIREKKNLCLGSWLFCSGGEKENTKFRTQRVCLAWLGLCGTARARAWTPTHTVTRQDQGCRGEQLS